MQDREQKIRERAHAIWESEGRKESAELDHWRRAEQQHEAMEAEAADLENASDRASRQIIEDEDRPLDAETNIRPPSMASPD